MMFVLNYNALSEPLEHSNTLTFGKKNIFVLLLEF